MRKLAISLLALGLFTAACGGSQDAQPEESLPPLAVSSPSAPAPVPTSTTPAFPPLSDYEFTGIGYQPANAEKSVWKSSDERDPVLYSDGINVTAFRYNGITCKVALDGKQVTPSRARIMFAAATRDGLKRGRADYVVGAQGGGTVKAGSFDCK